MPAATTHSEFAKEVYARLPMDAKSEIRDMHMFCLGSQGPDALFFSKASLFPGSLKRYGNMMHKANVREAIQYLDEHTQKDKELRSYFYGYLCHYALDSVAHPLVFAISRKRHDEEGVDEGEIHVTMEADIDVWLLHQRGRKTESYNVYEDLKVTSRQAGKLADLYHGLMEEVYHLSLPKRDLKGAFLEIAMWTQFIAPSRKKYNFLYGLELALRIPHGITGMMLVDRHGMEIINLSHKAYPLSYDATRSISASFPQLYGKALQKALGLIDSCSMDAIDANFNGEPIV